MKYLYKFCFLFTSQPYVREYRDHTLLLFIRDPSYQALIFISFSILYTSNPINQCQLRKSIETILPYRIPNNISLYEHKESSYPPIVTKRLPKSINKLPEIWSMEGDLRKAAPPYQNAFRLPREDKVQFFLFSLFIT